jgi:hypothetical protein
MAVVSVPVRTNAFLRPSRLMHSISSYIRKSVSTIVRIFVVYKPFRFFMTIAAVLLLGGLLVSLRFLYYYMTSGGGGHIQSLILASILVGFGGQLVLVAFLSDLLSVNRRLLEDVQYRIKIIENIAKDE